MEVAVIESIPLRHITYIGIPPAPAVNAVDALDDAADAADAAEAADAVDAADTAEVADVVARACTRAIAAFNSCDWE